MTSAFSRDLEQIIAQTDPNKLGVRLPIGGKSYLVKCPTTGAYMRLLTRAQLAKAEAARLEAAADLGIDAASLLHVPELAELVRIGDVEQSFHQDILGDVLQQMMDDDVPYVLVDVAAQAAWIHFFLDDGPRMAQLFWEAGGDAEKALALSGASVEIGVSQHQTGTRARTGGGSMTQKRASRNGTKSRKKPKRR